MLNNAMQSVSHQLPPTSGVTLKMLELSPVMVLLCKFSLVLLHLDAVCEPVGPLFRGAVPLDQPLQGHWGEEESSEVALQCSPASWLSKGCSVTESLFEVGASCTTFYRVWH